MSVDFNSLFRLDGKVAIVTGSTKGIGTSCAELMAAAGAKVVVCGRSESDGESVCESINQSGGTAEFIRTDVSLEADWNNLIERTIDTFGSLEVLVNNAAIDLTKPLLETSVTDLRRLMSVNMESVFIGTKLAIEAMRPGGVAGRGGSIVNVGSIISIVGHPFESAYSASKGAVRQFTKAVAIECCEAGYPIRLNSVHPAVVNTPMLENDVLQQLVDGGLVASREEARAYLSGLHPMGRLGDPIEIASAVLFFASDASAWITGGELAVDGGFTAQ